MIVIVANKASSKNAICGICVAMCEIAYLSPDGHYVLGHIDEYLLPQVFKNNKSVRGLHTDTHGLFFLPAIGTKGRVTEVCAFGYPRIDGIKFEENSNTKIHLFLYVVLYRPTDKTQTLEYIMKHRPVVVHHGINPGCLSQDDDLNWIVEEGDLLGVFIPDDCTTPEDLISHSNVDTLMEVSEFCPSHIDLTTTVNECYIPYLNSNDVIEFQSVDFKDIGYVSVKLNVQVKIEEGAYKGALIF